MRHFPIYMLLLLGLIQGKAQSQDFSIGQVSGFPFPSELAASPIGEKIAWAMNEQGKRNIYLAEDPDFQPQKITGFETDDGQEISSLQFSPDGEWLVFVRGGDHGGGNANVPVNPMHLPEMPKVEIWKIELATGKLERIGEGDQPVISTDLKIAYLKNGQVWTASLQNPDAPKQLFQSKGNMHSLQFSPDGSKLMFVTNRGSHSFVGIYTDEDTPLHWVSPSFSRDSNPRWSPDGSKIAFIRTPGGVGAAHSILVPRHNPWEIWVTDLGTGESYRRWKSPETLRGSVPTVHGGFNLHWAADDQLIYLSYEDGWPHLYTMDVRSGASVLLTPGDFMVEHVSLSIDGKHLYFSANTGPDAADIDRRHIGMVDIQSMDFQLLTRGDGIEAIPVPISSAGKIAFLSATAKRPLLPAVMDMVSEKITLLGEQLIPSDFPQTQLVQPKQVQFEAPDGVKVYGQIFEKEGGPEKKAAIVFVHGGPQRQMLLGWSYMDYYANTYAVNQYLANLGFVVLSVNYRLGIGYGYEFHKPAGTYWQGAGEYLDVKAAGQYLAGLDQVDAGRIGIYGGSYGGYLTALALAKDPDLFVAGVDIHGVHNLDGRAGLPDGYEKAPDYEKAVETAWYSSPIAYLDNWKSPVLFIHADDDRNVNFRQSADFIRRLEEKKIPFDYLVIPDDTHHWMKFSNMLKANQATVDFLQYHLKP